MNAAAHFEKARRILRGIDKLDADEDAIAIIDGTMIAGYHLGNGVLHAEGASASEAHWNTPSKLEIATDALSARAKSAYALFAELEELRSRYVRNRSVPEARIALRAREALRDMAEICGVRS